MNRKKVLIGIFSAALIIIIIDIILVLNDIPTISNTILYYSTIKKLAFFPFFFGGLCGHFFIPNNIFSFKVKNIIIILCSILLLLQIINSFIIYIHPAFSMLVGIISGALIFNQKRIK